MYDLLVLTFNERKPSKLHSKKIHIKAINKVGRKKQKYYHELWPFINNCYGVLYKLFTEKNLGEFECCDEMFDFNDEKNVELFKQQFIPSVMDEYIEDWVSMQLDVEYKEEFANTLDTLLSCSPISTIAFLCRGQSYDKEIIIGTFSRNEFLKMIDSGNIKTNICYLVTQS